MAPEDRMGRTSLPEFTQRWINYTQQLQELPQISIPRWLGILRTSPHMEIHGFCDASNMAMAAVAYLRINTENESVTVRLICSKTRVAPLKLLTIPRLELTAAVILTRLIKHLITVLDVHEMPIFLWTDSLVTLNWISSHPSRWKDYVRNRVVVIQDTLPDAAWRFVPGNQNPADCASRGITIEQLTNHPLWWNGPNWLSESPSTWPLKPNSSTSEVTREERIGKEPYRSAHLLGFAG